MGRFVDLVSNPARKLGPLASPERNLADPSLTIIKLDSNENPLGPSRLAVQAMRRALNEAHRYPDDDCSRLRNRLADFHSVAPEQVLVTAGSTQMLALLCQTMLAPGLNAVTSERSFIIYKMAVEAAGAELVEVPMRGDAFDLAMILKAINKQTRLVLLANPNNPTGTMLDAATLDEFIAQVPDHVVVMLDEAYHEFGAYFAQRRGAEYSSSLDYLRQGASVVVLRTFSKVHGLANLRIGYGLGPAESLGYCARMRSTYSVSSVAEAAALAAMDDHAHIQRTLENNADQAQVLGLGLSELGFRVIPTWANFLYCECQGDAANFARQLLAEAVSVRPLSAWGAPQAIRVSIGTPQDDAAFLAAAQKISGKSSAPTKSSSTHISEGE
jgi:histidinol-phosphate aminotransferase